MRHAHTGQSFGLGLIEQSFHFPVESVPHLFEHDIGIGILTRMLSDGSDTGKHFVHICHVEVTAKGKVLRPPVVPSEKRMDIRYAGFSGGRITQMSHVYFPRKGQCTLGKPSIVQLLPGQILEVGLHRFKNFSDGTGTQRPFTEHILFTRICFQFHTCQSGTFLPTVMLFFHQQVELIEPIHPCPVLLFVILQRFKQTNHGNATFMFQLFHLFSI